MSRRPLLVLCASLALFVTAVHAEPARLVRDLETSAVNESSFPTDFAVWRGRAYFSAIDHRRGRELWTTDGSRQGTRLVRDVSPGPISGANPLIGPDSLAPGEDLLWLVLDDGASGQELWASDGTAAGTRLVRDLCPGPCDGRPSGLLPWRGAVFFAHGGEGLGSELWVSDGTNEGTRQVRDVCPGECSSFPEVLAELEGFVLFAAEDAEHGRELWRSDGTTAGTTRVVDLCPGPCRGFSLSSGTALLGGELFFVGFDEAHGSALWKTDGTAAGTWLVWELSPGPGDGGVEPYVFGDDLLLVADRGRQLWRSDGTTHGTVRLLDLPAGVTVFSPPTSLEGPAGPRAFFFTRSTAGGRLWTTDGTSAGTRPVADVAFPWPFGAVAGGRLIFEAGLPPDSEPWVSDGTPEGTHRLRDLRPGTAKGSSPDGFAAFGPSHVLFRAETGRGHELWITDGTEAGTRLLKDIDGPDRSSDPTALTVFDDRLYFAAARADDGPGLWASDGSAEGTTLVAAGLRVEEAVAGPDRLFFAGGDAEAPRKPWVSDGTAAGTVMLSPLEVGEPIFSEGPAEAFAHELVVLGGTLFFAEGGQRFGQRLWASDGTPAGTRVVRDLNPDWGGACAGLVCPPTDYPRALVAAGGRLFFVGRDDEHGAELWTSDGTEAGTTLVVDLRPGRASAEPADLTPAGRHVYFTAAKHRRLWRTDGTAAGTVGVRGLGKADPRELTALGERLYLIGARGSGDSLYACEPGCERAVRLRTLRSRGRPGFARDLTAVGERLFFAVFTDRTGEELWTSDGTAAGTRLVPQIAPGARGSHPQSLTAVDGRLFFAADDGGKGLELWTSDGTAEGTCRVDDVAPGSLPSAPAEMTALGDLVFFAADGGAVGRELWSVPRQVRCRR